MIAALVLVSTVAGGALVAAPADAASPTYPRVMPVVASDHFLVYRQKTTSAYGLSLTKGSTLYSLGTSGARHSLKEFDPQLFPSLQGSTLVQSAMPNSRYAPDYDPTAPEHVRWRDLKTGAKGVTELPPTDDFVGAAPGGWIATRSVAATSPTGLPTVHVIRYDTAGKIVDLGLPFGSSTLSVSPGPKGIVVYSGTTSDADGTGSIRYIEYRSPGRWRTVYAAGKGVDIFCTPPSSTHVVCSVDRPRAKRTGQVLLSLTSTRKVWLSDHPKTCQVLSLRAIGSRAVGEQTADQGPCVDGRLTQLGANGKLTLSTRLWGKHASNIVEGFGTILIDSADQRRIVSLRTVGAKPKTLVTAH